jgi:hypothetical protein
VAAELELRTVIEGKGETLVDGTRVEKMCLAPTCAAVSLTVKDGSSFMYRRAILVVRREIKLSDFDIVEVRPRKVVMGAVILEIASPERGREKASFLAERIAGILRMTSGSPCRREWRN